jgi:hypothetical protein
MTTETASRRRLPRYVGVAVVVGAAVVALAAGALTVQRQSHRGQAMSIPDNRPQDAANPWATPTRSARADARGPSFVTSVSPNGRYFLDQYGKPILVKGDAPWAMMTRVSPGQAGLWFADRQRQGFNAAIISLVGAPANGAPNADGSTFDGLHPFTDGDILKWQEPYWQRVKTYLRMAADHGITIMLFPIDGWTIGNAFAPTSTEQCHRFGIKLAQSFKDLPNIVWMSGGDYFPRTDDLAQGSDVDHCIDAMMRGIRETGDSRPFSMEMGFLKSVSTENPYWARRVDWNFAYTYFPTYRAVLDAYQRQPSIPAILGESNYEGENNQPETAPTTDETLRRQVLWSLTSGAAGEFVGSHDWAFHDGWEERLSTRALTQIERLRSLFSTLRWWQLVPDAENELVTGGRGTELTTDEPMDVLDNDYVTAAKTPDDHLAMIYLPTQRTITVNRAGLPAGTRASWIDPTSGVRHTVPMASTFTTPGPNAEGDHDWILQLTS